MSEEIQINPEAPEQPSAGTEKPDFQKRIDNLVAQKNSALAELEKLKAEQAKREAEALAKQGEYKTLYEQSLQELEPLKQSKAELEALRTRIEQRNKERLALIPEDKRALIPEIDDAVKLEAWLDRSLSLIVEQQRPQAPKGDGGARGNVNPNHVKLTAEEESFARMAGMSLEQYAAQKARRGDALDISKLKKE